MREGLEVGRGLVAEQALVWHNSPGRRTERSRAWRRVGPGGGEEPGAALTWGRGLAGGARLRPRCALEEAAFRARRPGRGVARSQRKSGILGSFVFARWEGFHRMTVPPCP